MKENKKIVFQGFGGKSSSSSSVRLPVESAQGVQTNEFFRIDTDLTHFPGGISLSKIQVVDILSEGPIEGLISGEYKYQATIGNIGYDSVDFTPYAIPSGASVNWLRSIYWNQVPLVDSENKYNFQSIDVAFTPGLPNGSTIGQVSNELTVTRPIGERLRFGEGFAKTYRLINRDIKSFELNLRFTQLSVTDTNPSTYGDVNETTVAFRIYWRPVFSTIGKTPPVYPYYHDFDVRGNVSQGFIKNLRVNLLFDLDHNEPDFIAWETKIQRTTPDSTSTNLRNMSYVDSLTEVYGDVFTYPNSALVSARFSAEYFSQVPTRAFDAKLLKVQVPSNYDPLLKTYDGEWDGLFKDQKEWTDNPAWCYYDLITNKRYGLGKYISEDNVDKWSLYEIAKYCDTMVPDGEGGVEPRFTCNLVLNTREEAYKVLNDMASIFRAMVYYFAGSISTVQDAFKAPVFQFTNANVVGGDFVYSTSSRKVRHTVAIVRYNDKNNFYKPAVEYVEDFGAIQKYGIRELEITAFGCTSRGQAIRLGRWAIASETLETETVTFDTDLEGAYIRPGDIVQLQDNNKTNQRLGGRVNQVYNSSRLQLDSYVSGLDPAYLYYFNILTPTFNYEPSQVDLVSSANTPYIRNSQLQITTFVGTGMIPITGSDGRVRGDIYLSSPLDSTNYTLSGNMVWTIEGSGITNPYSNQFNYFRIINIKENDSNSFNVTALQYESGKFDAVESGVNFQTNNYKGIIPGGPTNLQLTLQDITSTRKNIHYTFTLPAPDGVVAFRVYAKNGSFSAGDFDDSTYLISSLSASEKEGDYIPTAPGNYYLRVYAVNQFGTFSTVYAENNIQVTFDAELSNIVVGGLLLTDDTDTDASGASKKSSTTTSVSPVFKWQLGVTDPTALPDSDFYYRLTVRQPTSNNIPSKNIYFQETGLSKNQNANLNYTFDFNDNLTARGSKDHSFGPYRKYDVVIELTQPDGTSSAGGNFITNGDSDFNNPNGYDILSINNPPVDAVVLTDTMHTSPNWQTDQWINSESEIKLNFIKNSFPSDLAGGYVYYSTGIFNRVEALNLIPTNKTISKYTITNSGNPIVISAGFPSSQDQGYMSVSLFDVFDAAYLNQGYPIEPNLNMSNVTQISKRGTISTYSNSFFTAWVGTSVNANNGALDSIWANTSAGISNIQVTFESDSGVGSYAYYVYFTTPFPNTNYCVMGYNPESFSSNHQRYVKIEKYTDHFVARYFIGTIFWGILYNTKNN